MRIDQFLNALVLLADCVLLGFGTNVSVGIGVFFLALFLKDPA